MSDQWQYPGRGPQGPGWAPHPGGQSPPRDYGYQPPSYQPYGWGLPGAVPQAPSNGMATASLVLGIVFIVFFFLGLVTLAGDVLAIVFGSIASSRASRTGAPSKGRATAGIVLGCVALVFYIGFGALTLGIGWII